MKKRSTFKLLMLVMLLALSGVKVHAQTTYKSFTNGEVVWLTKDYVDAAAWITKTTTSAKNQAYNIDPETDGSASIPQAQYYVIKTNYLTLNVTGVTTLWIYFKNAGSTDRTVSYSLNDGTSKELITINSGTSGYQSIPLDGGNNSIKLTATNDIYVIAVKAVTSNIAAPVFTPAAGEVVSGQVVTATTTTSGATIRYTTDGNDPVKTSDVFPSTGIAITETTTIKAAAFDSNGSSSVVTTATYTIKAELNTLSDYSWIFKKNDFTSITTSTSYTFSNNTVVNEVEISESSQLKSNNVSVNLDGEVATAYLVIQGQQWLHLKVAPNSIIYLYACSSGNGARTLNVKGQKNGSNLETISIIGGTTANLYTYTYQGEEAQDLYLQNNAASGNGIWIYGIKVEPNTTKTTLSQFDFVLGDVYLHDGNGSGKFINSSDIEYDDDFTKLRLKLKIQPDVENLNNASFTVTSSNPSVINADGVSWSSAGTERIYIGQFTVAGTGTTTISVTFNGNDEYEAKTITQNFTVTLPTQPVLSYTGTNTVTVDGTAYPYIQIKTGGATGMLALSVTPESYRNQVTYSWEPIMMEDGTAMSSTSLITIDENGVVTTANKKGRALVTATIDHPYYGAITASYVAVVVISGSNAQFKYGDNILFDYYEGCVYTNPLIHYGGSLTWSVSDTSVATVNSNGKVSVKKEGTVIVTATTQNGVNYNYTLTTKANPRKYIVKEGFVPTVGQEVTDVPGIKMTYGGFTDNFGMGTSHTYKQPGTTTQREDKYSAAKTDANGLQSHNYFFTTGSQDPRYECSTDGYNGNIRGWERIRIKTDYLSKTVPVYGTYYQFEPEVDGMLTVNVLQTGSVLEVSQSTSKNHEINTLWKIENGTTDIIDRWNYKCLYLTDERGITIEAVSKASHTPYMHPYIYPEVTMDVNGDGVDESMPIEYRDILSLKPHIMGVGLGGASFPNYAYSFTYGATYDNDGNEIAGEASPFKIKKQMATAFGLSTDEPTEQDYIDNLSKDNVIHIMENERHGYWTLSQSNTTYTFPVEAGKTYFLYTDGSKLGFNSFSFMPDADAVTSTLEIDGADTQTAATTLGEKHNCTVTLNRRLIKDQPNSLMLPFTASVAKVREVFGEGTQVLHVESIDNCIHFVRHHHQMILAGEPCIIYPSNDENTQWVFENVTVDNPDLFGSNQYVPVSGAGYTFTGCFAKTDMPSGSYYVSTKKGETQTPNGEDIYIYRVSRDDWMSNTRAFFLKGSSSAGELGNAVVYNALDEDTGSDIDGIRIIQTAGNTAATNANGVYSISGQKMNESNLLKGIYIINGRKVVVK